MSTPFAIVGTGPSGLDVGLVEVLAVWPSALELALLHSLWQVGVIGVLVAAVFVVRPDLGPSTRATIASTALLLSAVVFSITLVHGLHQFGVETESMSAQATSPPVRSAAETIPFDANATRSFRPTGTAGLWLVGFVLLNLWTLVRVVRAHRLRTDAGDAPVHWQRRFEELLQRHGLSGRLRLRVSRIADSAMVIGWLKPAILVPAAAFAAMPPAQLEAVLLHELAHLRRRDPLLDLLQQLALNVLFFHPIAWWLRRVVVEQREFACDDEATAQVPERRDLARALLRLHALRHAAAESAFSSSLSSQGGSLMTRIERLTSETKHPLVDRRLRSSVIAMAAIATLGVSMTLALAGPTNPPAESKASALQAEMLEAWAVRLKKAVADGEIPERDAKSMYGRLAAAMATDRSSVENTPKRSSKSSSHRFAALKELINEGEIAHKGARPRLERLEAKFEDRNERDEIDEIEAAFIAVEKKLEAGILTEEEAGVILEKLESAMQRGESIRTHRKIAVGMDLEQDAEELEGYIEAVEKKLEAGILTEEEVEAIFERLEAKFEARNERNEIEAAFLAVEKKLEAGILTEEEAGVILEKLESAMPRGESIRMGRAIAVGMDLEQDAEELEGYIEAVEMKLEAGILTEEEVEAIFEQLELAIEKVEQDDD